jgi:hypothetical protein
MRARTLLLQFLLIAVCIVLGVALERRFLSSRKITGPARDTAPALQTGNTVSVLVSNQAAQNRLQAETNHLTATETPLVTLEQISSAIDSALTNRFFHARQAALAEVAATIAPEMASSALSLADKIPAGLLRSEFVQQLLTQWATMDPQSAFGFEETLPDCLNRPLISFAWLAAAPPTSRLDRASCTTWTTSTLGSKRTSAARPRNPLPRLPPGRNPHAPQKECPAQAVGSAGQKAFDTCTLTRKAPLSATMKRATRASLSG